MNKDEEFLATVLLEGGSIAPDKIAEAASQGGEALQALYESGLLKDAAVAGAEVMAGGEMTKFEKLIDNAERQTLRKGRIKPFGIEVVAEYLSLMESEIMALRMILRGRRSGLKPALIRERLREIDA
jgi:vacuolar-type H+-ATPase subunit C/Vma6